MCICTPERRTPICPNCMPNAAPEDTVHSLVEQLIKQAEKGLAVCTDGDGTPKVVITFRELRECQEFYKTLVTLWGGRYELPNDQVNRPEKAAGEGNDNT